MPGETPTSSEQTSEQEGTNTAEPSSTKTARKPQKGGKKSKKKSKAAAKSAKRAQRPYPASSFEAALPLAEAIHEHAKGEKVRRLTLLRLIEKNPNSSGTRMLITNSSRYGLTTGSYAAEWLELTDVGNVATSSSTPPRQKLEARIKLAIQTIGPFNFLYEEYKGKKLPTRDVLKDMLAESNFDIENANECIDLFTVNLTFLGLLQTIAGAETVIPIEQGLDELKVESAEDFIATKDKSLLTNTSPLAERSVANVDWSKTCFVISPIGEDGSELRKHADLFLGSLIEPALKEFGLNVVRADAIGAAGMITSQIIEYLLRARLAIVDLSFHNPNAFYEMAIRHASKLPIVQISRKLDRLPFDVNQVRTVVIDTTDIYSLVPKLETYRSEIATQVRAALADGTNASNPITTFFPGFNVTIPKEK